MVSAEVSSGEDATVTVNESEAITALKVSRDETLEKELDAIKEILTDETKTSEEKSDAYEALKSLNSNKGKEETLEKLIKTNYNFDAFVKIDGSNVKVVIDETEHSYELANKIIKTVQGEFDSKMYITVNFETK
jgi:stage III sporulation protein AH